MNSLLNVIFTGRPSSPSAPLSPWNKRDSVLSGEPTGNYLQSIWHNIWTVLKNWEHLQQRHQFLGRLQVPGGRRVLGSSERNNDDKIRKYQLKFLETPMFAISEIDMQLHRQYENIRKQVHRLILYSLWKTYWHTETASSRWNWFLMAEFISIRNHFAKE